MKPRKNSKYKFKGIQGARESLGHKEGQGKWFSGSDPWEEYQSDPSKKKNEPSVEKKRDRRERKKIESGKRKDGSSVPYLKITAIVFLLGAVIFFLIAVTVAMYAFFSGSFFVSAENIVIEIEGPEVLSAGEEGNFNITVRNRNDVSLYNTKLVIRYPEAARDKGDTSVRMPTERVDLGDFRARGVSRRDVSFSLFGKEGEEYSLIVDFEYNIEGSGAQFEKREEFIITIDETPMTLELSGPRETYLNSREEYRVRLASMSDQVLNNIRVRVDYPINFRLLGSEMDMTRDSWNVESLAPGEEKEFVFYGLFSEYSHDERGRTVSVSAGPSEDSLVRVAESVIVVNVDEQPFDIEINLDENISFGDRVEGELVWKNRGGIDMREASIDLSFIGEVMGEYRGSNATRSAGGLYWGDKNVRFLSENEIVIPFSFDVLFPREVDSHGLELRAVFEGETFEGEPITAEKTERVSVATFFEMEAESDLRRLYNSNQQSLHPITSDKEGDLTMTLRVLTGPSSVENAVLNGVLPSNVKIDRINASSIEMKNVEFDNDKGEFSWKLGYVEEGSNIWNRGGRRNIFLNLIIDLEEDTEEDPIAIEFLELVGVDEYSGRVLERTLSNISIYGSREIDIVLDD